MFVVERNGAIEGIDFGNQPVRPGSIHGVKWMDDNGNAERDPDEPGLPGVTIYLDLNNNGMPDPDEPSAETMEDNPITDFDEGGLYWLEVPEPGTYLVREVVPDGFVQTFPGDETEGAHEVRLGSGDVVERIDFGNFPILLGSIHGFKWLDLNGNHEHDPDEPGLGGVIIYSDSNFNGHLDEGEPATETMVDDPDTTTDETGLYWLEDLRTGVHFVKEVEPEGHVQTFPFLFHSVSLELGGVVEGIDFGNWPIRPGSIHGFKWMDLNGNHQRDPNEPGLGGVIIYSDRNFNGRLDEGEPATRTMEDDPDTVENEAGLYWLEVLRPGVHIVREIVPEGFAQTFPFLFNLVHLEPGGSVDGIDFGNWPIRPGSIHGFKWLDLNGNHERDSNEPGLAGVIIYSDLNFNGHLDEGEPATRTMEDDPDTSADETGLYWLDDLRPGVHFVNEVVPDGFGQTFPFLFYFVHLESGGSVDGIDFGNWPIRPGSIHGFKWSDLNGNHQRDPDEPGLGGIIIYSDRNFNGQLDSDEPATKTMEDDPDTAADETGLYWLEDLHPGFHFVREVVPDNFKQTFPIHKHLVFLLPGATVDGVDFGNRPLRRASIHGLKWLDLNGNRERDPNEPGLPGVTIYLDRNGNGRLDVGEQSTVTMEDDSTTEIDEAGRYWLTGLHPGFYILREVVPDGFIQTFPLNQHFLFLLPGAIVEGIDFGNRPFGNSSIHGVKWVDGNGNGERDDNEPGLPGVTIYLDLNGNGELDDDEPHTVTMEDNPDTSVDEAGHYWLDGIEPGEYRVREVVPDGFVQTFPSSGAHGVFLEPGDIVEDIDFGNRPIGNSSIHGVKWVDGNGNGERETNEPRLPGVTIYLDLNNNGVLDDDEPHTVTMEDNPDTAVNEAGRYWLDGLEPGVYLVREVVPDGFVPTFPVTSSGLPGAHEVRLEPGDRVDGINFGNRPIGNSSIHGVKWVDGNGNGERETNEPGLPGVTIYLDLNNNGVLDDDEPHTVTMEDNPDTAVDEAGHYWLDGLEPGEYRVREVVPDGFVQTFPITSFGLPGAHEVFLEPGDVVEGVDFGNRARRGAIHGFKFEDFDADGVYEPNEGDVPFEGIPFALFDADGNLVDDARSNENGEIWFMELAPGVYTLRELVGDLPNDVMPSTPTEVRLTLEAGEEITWHDGVTSLVFLPPPDKNEENERPIFGNFVKGSIHGFKFEDLDGNGGFDPTNERGFPGIRFQLADSSGNVLDEVTTDDNGEFWFTGLRPGEYIVRELLPPELISTTPAPASLFVGSRQELVWRDGAAMLEPDSLQVEVNVGDALVFGNHRPVGSIHGFKFEDFDADGVYEPEDGEAPFPGILFQLFDAAGNLVGQVTTNDNGEFWFVGLAPGRYTVREVTRALPDDIMPSTPTEVTLDVRPGEELVWRDGAAMLPLDSPQDEVNVGEELIFGNFVKGSIHGFKFEDRDGDGFYEPNDGEQPFPGFRFELIDAAGKLVGVIPTNLEGEFWFTGLIPGRYTVREVVQFLPLDIEPTTPIEVTLSVGSRQELVWEDGAAMLEPGALQVEVNVGDKLIFGNRRIDLTGSIHGFKFEDMDGDGDYEPNEGDIPFGGIRFGLFNGSGTLLNTMPTDDSGQFWFLNLPPGEYRVRETLAFRPDIMPSTPPSSPLLFVGPAQELVWRAGAAMLPANSNKDEVLVGDRLMFGNFVKGSIHGFKFEDLDGDGIYDPASEGPFEGVTFQLVDADGNVLGTKTTDANGEFWFTGLRPGEYRVRERVPFGLSPTTPAEVTHLLQSGEELVWREGAAMLDEDALQEEVDVGETLIFGNQRNDEGGSIHGFKFEDFDGDGVYEPSEGDVPMGGVPFLLFDAPGNTVDESTTNENGEFWFVDLPSGQYHVQENADFSGDLMPSTPTFRSFFVARSEEIVWREGAAMLPAGSTKHETFVGAQLMFGNFVKGSIHGFKFEDLDGDGIFDSNEGESPMPGIRFELSRNSLVLDLVPTISSGEFWFTGLVPGLYIVREMVEFLPTGFVPTTPVERSFFVGSGQELVWQEGAAMLETGAPKEEILVENGGLIFGNRRLLETGSIHGTKWEDIDGDGVRYYAGCRGG